MYLRELKKVSKKKKYEQFKVKEKTRYAQHALFAD